MWRLIAYVFDFIIVVIIGRLLNHVLQRLFRSAQSAPGNSQSAPGERHEPARSGATIRDPVCGIFVSTELSHRLKSGAETLHFCSQECLERYQKSAARV